MNESRFWLTVFLVGLVIALLTMGGVHFSLAINRQIGTMIRSNVESLSAAQELRIAFRDLRNQLLRYQLDPHPDRLKDLPQVRDRLLENMVRAEMAAATEKEKELTARVRRGIEDLFDRIDAWKATGLKADGLVQLQKLLEDRMVKEVLEPNREYLRFNSSQLERREEETQEISTYLSRLFVLTGTIGILLGVGGGIAFASWMRRYQKRVNRKLLATTKILKTVGQKSLDLPQIGSEAPNPSADLLDDVEGTARKVAAIVEKSERDALRAEQLAKVGQMAAGIAHEIRNPLTSIKLLVQNLEQRRSLGHRDLSDREWRIMEDEIERMETTLNGFLDFARPPRPVRQMTNLRNLIGETLNSVGSRAKIQKVHLVPPESAEPIFAEIDQGQIRQVLTNLLINGLDAQSHGGELRVELSIVKDQPDWVEIRVADKGPGLAEGLGDTIFEPFQSTKETGLGLGLSISRRIVEGHGGTLEGFNSSEGGAVFTLRIPQRSQTLRHTG